MKAHRYYNYVRPINYIVLLFITCLTIYLSNRGFNLADESYYVFWSLWPNRFDASIHPFGIILYPVSELVGGSVIGLRIFGIIANIASAYILGNVINEYYRRVIKSDLSFDPKIYVPILSFLYYGEIWIFTPSYNLMANFAGCLILAGSLGWSILDAESDQVPKAKHWVSDVVPTTLVGAGGCLAFFSKPTFAALAAVAIFIQLGFIWRRHGVSIMARRAIMAASLSVCSTAFIIAEVIGLDRFLETFRNGMRDLRFGNSLLSLPAKTVVELIHAPIPVIVTVLSLIIVILWKLRGKEYVSSRLVRYGSYSLLFLNIIYFIIYFISAVVRNLPGDYILGPPVLSVIVSMLIVGIISDNQSGYISQKYNLVFLLIMLPFAISFGTANGIITQIGYSAYAFLLAGAIIADISFRKIHAVFVHGAFVVFTIMVVLWSFHLPFGLPASIGLQNKPIRVFPNQELMYVDSLTESYILGLRKVAERERLTADVPIIDISGGGPGTALMLNANAPYFPWAINTFKKDSALLADAIWGSLSSQQQGKAWIIMPVDPAFADTNVVKYFESRRSEYHLAGSLRMKFWEIRVIEIWVPNRAKAPDNEAINIRN